MRTAVFDLEANGLHDATKIWCIVIKDVDTKEIYKYGPEDIKQGIVALESYDRLIGHNIIDFDSYLLRRLHGARLHCLWDSLVASRLLYPDRPNPVG